MVNWNCSILGWTLTSTNLHDALLRYSVTVSPRHRVTGSPGRWFTVSPRRRITASPRHRVTASLCHLIIVSPHPLVIMSLCHCVTASPRHCVIASSRHRVTVSPDCCVTASPFHRVAMSLWHPVAASPHHCVPASLRHRVVALLQGTFPTVLRPAVNSIVCTGEDDGGLLTAVFHLNATRERSIQSRCRAAQSRCQQCLQEAGCQRRGEWHAVTRCDVQWRTTWHHAAPSSCTNERNCSHHCRMDFYSNLKTEIHSLPDSVFQSRLWIYLE